MPAVPTAMSFFPHSRQILAVLRLIGVVGMLLSAVEGSEIAPGTMSARVICAHQPEFSYAVYVPASYDAAQRWPVLYCIDPSADGETPVQRFRAAAEKIGCIVAGSNNARNGPWGPSAVALEAMVRDVNARWHLDPDRAYAAGFSGGARMASRLASAGIVQGVIACGGGFSGAQTPPVVAFDFFGAAGEDDFNRAELEQIDRDLDARGTAHRIDIFRGGHEWLPASLAVTALEWLERQRPHAGLRSRYGSFIAAAYQEKLSAAAALSPAAAVLEYRLLALDFQRLADVTAAKNQAETLRDDPAVRAARSQLRAREKQHARLRDELLSRIRESNTTTVVPQVASWLAAPDDRTAADVRQRVVDGSLVAILGTVRSLLARGDYSQGATWLRAATALSPTAGSLQYDLACVESLAGNPAAALAALEEAIAGGFNDVERMKAERALAPLRDDSGYTRLLALIPRP